MNRDPAPRVIVAPQSFKGSADAVAVASAIARGIRHAWPGAHIEEMPLADGGAALARLGRIDGQTDPRLVRPSIEVACDVRNPLLGPEGASAIYGPQKGATPEIVRELDAALARYADVVEAFVGRSIRDVPGAGAAGGLGAGLLAFLDARLISGAELVLRAVGFAERIAGADLVVTGEGRVDQQSGFGKLTGAVTAAARRDRRGPLDGPREQQRGGSGGRRCGSESDGRNTLQRPDRDRRGRARRGADAVHRRTRRPRRRSRGAHRDRPSRGHESGGEGSTERRRGHGRLGTGWAASRARHLHGKARRGAAGEGKSRPRPAGRGKSEGHRAVTQPRRERPDHRDPRSSAT